VVTDAELAALGVHRIPVPIPFPQAGGPVNVYLLEEADGAITLVDAGLGSGEAQAALEAGLARLGRSPGEVRRIVVTHGHVDHFGAARFVQERCEAEAGRVPPVYCHPADAPKITEGGRRWRDTLPLYGAYLARLGVPPEVLAAIARAGERSFGLARRVKEALPIGEGEVIETRRLRLEVLHMPGHTPGLVCLYDRERRIFLSDDHLLERVSPNPLIELGPGGEAGLFRPLLAYLASVARMRALEIDVVLPGHGPPFSGHREVIDRLTGFYAKRQARIVELLAGGSLTPYAISRALFPAAKPEETFLTVSETIANLEVLEHEGRSAREERDGGIRFALPA